LAVYLVNTIKRSDIRVATHNAVKSDHVSVGQRTCNHREVAKDKLGGARSVFRCDLAPGDLALAKTPSATKNGAILGREGVNTISIASTEHRDFREQGPVRACGAHTSIFIFKDGRKVDPD
jgi:hypothetical protein